jgi:hypothetical protein
MTDAFTEFFDERPPHTSMGRSKLIWYQSVDDLYHISTALSFYLRRKVKVTIRL